MGKNDWREKYETMISKAVDSWYTEAFKNPMAMYIYHAPAQYPAWGDILIASDKPSDRYELSTGERIPYAADKRVVRHMINRLHLPVIGE